MWTILRASLLISVLNLVFCAPEFRTHEDSLAALSSGNPNQRHSAIAHYYHAEEVPPEVVPALVASIQQETESDYIVRGLYALSKSSSLEARRTIEQLFDSSEREIYINAGRALQKWLVRNGTISRKIEEYDPSKNFLPVIQKHFLPTTRESVVVIPEQCPTNAILIGSIYRSAGGISQRRMIDKLRDDAASVGGNGICNVTFGEGTAGVAIMNMILTQSLVWNGNCRVFRTSLDR
jgi:hypothetical protein